VNRHVFGLMVIGDEAGRYLYSAIDNAIKAVDVLFVFGDQPTDGSEEIVKSFPSAQVLYQRRSDGDPSFLEHEGRFRQASWETFEVMVGPTTNDWIIGIDSDEVLVGPTECRPCDLKPIFDKAGGADAVLLPRPEVWGYDDQGWPLLRKDGYWGNIQCTRLFRYKPGGRIRDIPMGCGNEPEGFIKNIARFTNGVELLHYGYVHPDDRQDKYERYTRLSVGHDPRHIQSILATPTLVRWNGLIPPTMERGKTVHSS